ncbi:MAG: hypothetical protein ABI839_02060 [Verrucomicrobiota bacterium]
MNRFYWKRRRVVFAAGLVSLLCAASSGAQVVYVKALADGTLQLHRMNGDGTGDVTLTPPIIIPGLPVFSRAGTEIAVTGYDPAASEQHSSDVFGISTATGAVRKLVDNHDQLDPVNQAFSYTFPLYKAFSPNHAALAVFSVVQTGGPNSGHDGGGVVELPVLEVYSLTAAANPLQVHVDKMQDGRHHGGEGIDWSPTSNVLAAPLASSAPFLSGGGPGPTTAIFLIDPVDAAVLHGRARQITFPRADANISTGLLWTEHDYQPRFSPNGAGLAFVRSFQSHALTSSLTPDPDVQSLHILNVSTGADTQVITFPRGTYVTTLDWSPNGSQLIFDLSLQVPSINGPLQRGRPETNQVYVVNVNGTGLTQLRGNGNGTPAWSRTALSTGTKSGSLNNISTRLEVLSGNNVGIGGFIIGGTGPKKVLLRGIGPSLAQFGVPGVLADPMLSLHTQDAQKRDVLIATNDSWKINPQNGQSQLAALAATGKAPTSDSEPAMIATLNPGSYTVILSGKNNSTGNALLDAYDLSGGGTSLLTNISTRGFVSTGNNVLIGGFILGPSNSGAATVLLRVIGPALGPFGINNFLADPTLELHNANGALLASNDDWQADAQAAQIPADRRPPNPKESALRRTLAPGNYTAIVRGKNNTTGVALVEVYYLSAL